MDEAKGSVKGAARLASSVLLVAIVAIFLLYANTIFIKRREKIGLFQLIGLTKGKIFRILSAENLILYFGSMVIGILPASRLRA